MLLTSDIRIDRAVAAVRTREPRTLKGEFFEESIYRGPPSPELDAAWAGVGDGSMS